MKRINFIVQVVLALRLCQRVMAQGDIPLGTWRLHPSYNKLIGLANSANTIFAASENAILILDKTNSEVSTVSKTDGLSTGRVSALGYDETGKILVVAFENGLVNFISDSGLIVLDRISSSTAISSSKKINHIYIKNGLSYLSTDFGVVVLDMNKFAVKETYRDLGETGGLLKISKSVVHEDSLFLATENGVLSGSLSENSNLLDFRNWKRYNSGDFDDQISAIAVYDDQVYAAIDSQGIYRLINGLWSKEIFFPGEIYNVLEGSSSHLLVAVLGVVHLINGQSTSSVIPTGEFTNPLAVAEDSNGVLWMADETRGLISFASGFYSSFTPGGPSTNEPWKLCSDAKTVVSLHGGYSSLTMPLHRSGVIDEFNSGQWRNSRLALDRDIMDFAKFGETSYYASFGYGLEGISSEGSSTIYNELNSPLVNSNTPEPFVLIPSIQSSGEGIWVANYDSPTPLHLLKPDLRWESFSFSLNQTQFPSEILVDRFGQVWMMIDPGRGGGLFVFNKGSNTGVFLSGQAGSGGLPSNTVLSIANDREGQVWVGTSNGVAYFPNPKNVFSGNINALKPIYENRFLFRNESINALAVDGGNRKWIGTNNGVWLFNATGEELIYNFTKGNSPLLDDVVRSIAIEPTTGEVFFATNNGMASFRSDASESIFSFMNVKIFPNPVTREFNGLVAINGLYIDAVVKITDISGKLIWQTRAHGGTASWNVRKLNGDRADSGMYLVFATSEDGSERHVGKIAVIE